VQVFLEGESESRCEAGGIKKDMNKQGEERAIHWPCESAPEQGARGKAGADDAGEMTGYWLVLGVRC
jgi:hypothetical protein